MALIADGVTPTQLLAVDNLYKAARVSVRPMDHGALGQYRESILIPLVVTQAANGTLFSFRWASATSLAVIQYIKLSVLQTAIATATIFPRYEVFAALGASFTASDSAGTAIAITGNNAKKRQNMGTTLVTDIRASAVAAGLTVGTRTLNANSMLTLQTVSTITTVPPGNGSLFQTTFDATDGNDHPLVLAQNEGFIVRGPTTVFGAAGTADLLVEVAWAEMTTF